MKSKVANTNEKAKHTKKGKTQIKKQNENKKSETQIKKQIK